jgi:NAD(P)H-nitrite reductase large subunit
VAEDILEKGAILQRDKASFAVAPHIPGGLITDFDLLRRIADVAEKYHVKAIKLTSAQRLALIGLNEADLSQVWHELGMVPGAAIGLCVRSVKICPGTDFCRIGLQDAVKVGLALDGKYHGFELPFKFKMGVLRRERGQRHRLGGLQRRLESLCRRLPLRHQASVGRRHRRWSR